MSENRKWPPVEETEVLIVGGGPVGLALALDLTHRGVDFMLVEAGDGRVAHPRVSTVGPRAMEAFRRWGVADAIRGAGWPADHTLDIAWVTAVGEHELYRLRLGTAGARPLPSYTPEPESICPQHWLAPLLTARLGVRPAGPVRLGTRLVEFRHKPDRVGAVLVDGAGVPTTVHARFLVGCDGASSPVRKACGIDAPERHRTRTLRNILFRAPGLGALLGPRTALVHFVTEPGGLRYPLRAIDGRDLYRLTCPAGPADAERVVRRATTVDVPVEVVSDATWHLTHRVASRYRDGRVFLAGDAAHTLSPSGGFGLATGVGDAADLGWKLAAELAGWAGAGLLDTYETERRPVAVDSLEESHRNLRRTVDRRLSAALRDGTEEGERARAELAREIADSDPLREFDAPDLHFAHRYASPAIAEEKGGPGAADGAGGTGLAGRAGPADGGERPATADGPAWNRTTLPGVRAPHAWLGPGRSTLDLFGGEFVLLCFDLATRPEGGVGTIPGPGPGPRPLDGFVRAFADRRVPLRVRHCHDREVAWRYERPFVLVRPDGHVAWRGGTLPADPLRIADLVRGAGA
ncbi:FAD-dependent monooxygenase [Streptomyces sp. NBC_00094]|uniref:FAD-dependent monooxygenase n=1 Tax=Streptomyces sp. NBC_00094 TaxID=2903620 RepID=UPI00225A1577|nr:FAD-dependent monooxygenase [Streptomyces sp. NBC_00094]MCX5389227.1 FAD-dependent monooxygenase [Streptomyces sp. NBC_00094]